MTPIRPTETTDYLRCPLYWQYRHVDKWTAPPAAWKPQMLLGTAVHAGFAMWWRTKDAAMAERALLDAFVWPELAPLELDEETHRQMALKALHALLKWVRANMADALPLMIEEPLGPDGHTTPDLVTREAGQLVVTDLKTSWHPRAASFKQGDITNTWQFLHYAWLVGQRLGEPVAEVRRLNVAGHPPAKISEATFQPTPELLDFWLQSANKVWDSMQAGNVHANPTACTTVYGRCAYWDACWTCHGDPQRMANFYTKEEA